MKKYLIKFSLITSVALSVFTLLSWYQTMPATAATYTVSFNASGGTGTMSSQPATPGVAVTLKANTFTKIGYNFTGWAITAKGPVVYSDGASYRMARAGNVTLYAVWKSACTYNIIFDANGGTRVMPMKEMIIGVSENLPINKFTKRAQTFSGWALTSDANETVTYPDGSPYLRNFYDTSDVTLYAVWTKTPYVITFNANGGIGAPVTQTIISGEKDFLKLNTYQREGYRFDGWATTATGPVVYRDGVTYTMGTAKVTLFAKWVLPAGTTVITFVPDWNTGLYLPKSGTGSMPPQIVPASTTVKLIPNAFKPEGCPNGTGYGYACAYNYNGWYDPVAKKSYAEQGYFTGTGIPSVILHAVWTERGAKAVDNHNYATTSLGWELFLKLLQALK